jgi:hypothetical protein
MPPIHAGAHLIEILFDIGPAKPMPMSAPVAIDETDLMAWQWNRGIKLSAFEAGAIKELSRHYAAQLMDAASPTCPPPYFPTDGLSEERRKKISAGMRDFASALNASRNV